MLDLIVNGGQVVLPERTANLDIGVKGEKIVAITNPGMLSYEGARVLDARGKIVVPGGIEPHAHVSHPINNLPERNLTTAPPEEDTLAAVFGGVTTIVDFCYQEPTVGLMQAVESKDKIWRGKSYIDYSFHVILKGQLPKTIIDEIPEAIQEGFSSYKLFTTHVRPVGLPSLKLDTGYFLPVFQQIYKGGGIAAIHAEDDDLIQHMYKRLEEEGKIEGWRHSEVHSGLSEDLAFRRVVRLAEQTGAAVYFLHVSAKEGVQVVEEARGKGLPVYAETLHNYACFTEEDYKMPGGFLIHTYPSLKSTEDREALWRGLIEGSISTTATDEYATPRDIKDAGQTILDMTGGHSGVETRMGIIYTEGVVKRGISLQRYVDLTSANAARILGFYPSKGSITPGSDADITIIDPNFCKKLTLDDLHSSDYSIWEGWEVQGWPVTTIVRGEVVVDNRELTGSLGHGKLLRRKISSEVLQRPVC
jgi:dihydropyrimidinase